MQIFAACWDFHLQYSGTVYLDRMSGWVHRRWRHSSRNPSWKTLQFKQDCFCTSYDSARGVLPEYPASYCNEKVLWQQAQPLGLEARGVCVCVLRALLWLWASSSVPQFLLGTDGLFWTAASQLSFPSGENSALARSTSCVNAGSAMWTVFHN